MEQVDELADELATAFDNLAYRKWYCGVIYEFGVERVRKWQQQSASGRNPGGLFGYYVRQARENQLVGGGDSTAPAVADKNIDTVYPVRGDETDDELQANMRTTLTEAGLSPDLGEDTAKERTNEDLLKDVDDIFFGEGTQ